MPLPETWDPQLATLAKEPPDGPGWAHELKHDGWRIGAFKDGEGVRLVSRNGKEWTEAFPEVVEVVRSLPAREALIDGEVVVLLPDGRSSFQALQNAHAAPRPREDLAFVVFDLLHLDGEDLTPLPLRARKERLAELVSPGGRIRLSEHFEVPGREVFRQACALGAEGVVSKRLDAPYRPGRGRDWIKVKCLQRQELVIGGFTDPKGQRSGIGALLVGVHEGGALRFAGKVGTGFTDRSARELRGRLEKLRTTECPFSRRPPGALGRQAHWVRPELVAEVRFSEWTADGVLRHPSFQGLREDKPPIEVVREDPDRVAGVRISHPERLVFPEEGLTKLDLARYYEAIAERMLPHVRGRPLTLFRCPGAIGPDCAFMKHSKVWAPSALRRVEIPEKTKVGEYLVSDTVEALVSLAQMDVIEVHTWNTRDDRVEQPDRVVLDLDPGPEVAWAELAAAARTVREVLEALGLTSFVKTTGGAGLHVVVPLVRELDWSGCLAFTEALAATLARSDPARFTTSFTKRGRDHKILVDYLRNNRTNTSVAAFSVRARPGAPVSAPISWEELDERPVFTVRTILDRRADPWAAYERVRQRIPEHAVEALRGVVGR